MVIQIRHPVYIRHSHLANLILVHVDYVEGVLKEFEEHGAVGFIYESA